MNNHRLSQDELIKMLLTRLLVFIAFMVAVFFLPAGTFAYWEAWVFLTVIVVFGPFFSIYFLKKEPELLERRMRTRKKSGAKIGCQNFVSMLSFYLFTPGY